MLFLYARQNMILRLIVFIFGMIELTEPAIIPGRTRSGEFESHTSRSFVIGDKCFLKDGQPFLYISGSFHYWRQPSDYWQDTFFKMRAAGLNAVQTYINWNLHEPEPEEYNFEGDINIRHFIQAAQKSGLLVVLRPGPFIDSEVDMGGLPYWLLRENSTMKLRTSDSGYLFYVERWYRKILPLLRELTYANGGPIISVQVENEYGWMGDAADKVYMEFLRDLTRELLPDVILFTTDGETAVSFGRVDGTLTTVDFGPTQNITYCLLDRERKYNPDGPLVNSEFYPGWLDHWGESFITTDYQVITKAMVEMLNLNASFNTYMFYGGSNFGFVAGANQGSTFVSVIQSYDYDAPISEAGDPTLKYMKMRETIQKYSPAPLDPVPAPRKKAAYGKFAAAYTGSLYDNLKHLCPNGPVKSQFPLTFEVLKQAYGFVLYRTKISSPSRDPAQLTVNGLHDRAVVLLDLQPIGILSRTAGITSLSIAVQPDQTLDLLVQNEGRICSGPINDMKGILGNVSIDSVMLTGWEMFPISLPGFPAKDPRPFPFDSPKEFKSRNKIPGFYSVKFDVDLAQDTFLQLDGWNHGYAFINGRNLGRYWPVQGPQRTLYIPGVYLKDRTGNQPNVLEVFELEKSPCHNRESCFVTFVDQPFLNGTVPG